MKPLCLLIAAALCSTAAIRVRDGRVELLAGTEVVAASPQEGLWSIACDWRDGWPADWHHATPLAPVHLGEWTVLRGELNACGGTWLLEDAYRPSGALIEARRRITWKGAATAPRVTLSVRFEAPGAKSNVLLPGIIYYGNPSGAKSGRVPVFTGRPGEVAMYEEHRYPMPFAFVELERGARRWGAALHSIPSPAPHANLPDQWWSLGVAAREGATALQLLSGPCASNGRNSVIKAFQAKFAPYDNAWLNIPPGGVVEKRFYLEVFPVEAEGSGFRTPLHHSIALFAPFSLDGMPGFGEIIQSKWRYAKTRIVESDAALMFQKYPDRKFAVMGWCGQAEAPAYALLALESVLNEPRARDIAQRSLDFLSTAQFFDNGFHTWYNIDKRAWERDELLSQGQAMLLIARAIAQGRAKKMHTAKWEAFLRQAAAFHAARILNANWHPRSTNEAAFVAPLVHAHRLFGTPSFKAAAIKAAEHYAARHVQMREPYWGGTLDAQCEDKEGAAAAFLAFLELYELTHEARHLAWARHAADVMLTYTVVWDIELPAGRLRDHRLKTRGWTVVSPQNQHLDVWGAVVAPDIYRLGQIDKREDLKRMALLMYRSCGQMIDPSGSQGEQLHHTNYLQRNEAPDIGKLRGGYNEGWTVFWITAHFLTGAARFAEMGAIDIR